MLQNESVPPRYSKQQEIPFFWPLTEQMVLDLEYGPTHLYVRAKGIAGVHSLPIMGSIYEFRTPSPVVGKLEIDEFSFNFKKKPKPLQLLLYKLLGFKWKKN